MDETQNKPEAQSKPETVMAGEEVIREALKQVYDPEIGLDIVSLGLVYNIQNVPEEGLTKIQYTLTSPGCPLGPIIHGQVQSAVLKLPGIKDVKLELVWNPPWDPHTMCSEDAKMELGIF